MTSPLTDWVIAEPETFLSIQIDCLASLHVVAVAGFFTSIIGTNPVLLPPKRTFISIRIPGYIRVTFCAHICPKDLQQCIPAVP